MDEGWTPDSSSQRLIELRCRVRNEGTDKRMQGEIRHNHFQFLPTCSVRVKERYSCCCVQPCSRHWLMTRGTQSPPSPRRCSLQPLHRDLLESWHKGWMGWLHTLLIKQGVHWAPVAAILNVSIMSSIRKKRVVHKNDTPAEPQDKTHTPGVLSGLLPSPFSTIAPEPLSVMTWNNKCQKGAKYVPTTLDKLPFCCLKSQLATVRDF